MNTEQAKKVKILLDKINHTEFQLASLVEHTFGFGAFFKDIDDFLRPQAKFFLESKLEKLKSELKDY